MKIRSKHSKLRSSVMFTDGVGIAGGHQCGELGHRNATVTSQFKTNYHLTTVLILTVGWISESIPDYYIERERESKVSE